MKRSLCIVDSYVTQQYELRTVQKHHCYQSSFYEKYGWLRIPAKEAIICYHQIDTIRCQQSTKEDTGKSTKNALYVLWYAKGTSWAEAMENSEKTELVPQAIVELH